ncbi:MAG: glycosyltransferase family 2 protein [Candidatus Omnitrophica bacterium]|nr:glycosyltransferase family 2 protein [Candidatus Omnitrophota bacterium]
MKLSIVIPAYNEAMRIENTLSGIKSFMDNKKISYEVIVVDDGSTDETSKISKKSSLAKAGCLKVLKNDNNSGKGYSVKRGVDEASGELILFSDADMSTPIDEFDNLSKMLDDGFDVVIGSRALGSSDVIIKQPFYRQTMGRIFNFVLHTLLGEKFKDTQCGFKLFTKNAAKNIFKEISIDGFAFDVEALSIARKYGYKIVEVGVKWENSNGSKVHPVLSSLEMLRDIIRVKLNDQ